MKTETKERNELEQPIWSVISFRRVEAKNLTFDQAAARLVRLQLQHISGLVIVTDACANRMLQHQEAAA